MKSTLFLFIALIVAASSFSQFPAQPHGTLLISIVCSDGIVIAADSRASWMDDNKTLYAYADSFRKVFQIGKFQIAISGESSFRGMYWEDILIEYNKRKLHDTTLLQTFNRFKSYLNKKYEASDSEILKTTFILAGYVDNKPVILGINSTQKQIESPVLTSSDVVNPFWNIPIPSPKDCFTTAKLIEEIYIKCSRVDSSIGGPLFILKIDSTNSISHIKTFRFKHFKNEKDFIKSILSERAIVTYVYPESKKALYDVLMRRLKILK